MLHFAGQLIYDEDGNQEQQANNLVPNRPNPQHDNQQSWKTIVVLKRISFILLFIVYPFFTVWSFVGTAWFVASTQETPECMRINDVDNEIIENARANVQEEAQKRLETIKTLNEYGIYYMLRGIQQAEFMKIKTINYRQIHETIGFSRCSICLNDFELNKKVKQFPKCEHLYHINCLDLWMNIEANCPNCLKTYVENQYSASISSLSQVNDTLPTEYLSSARFQQQSQVPINNFLVPPMQRIDLNGNGQNNLLNTPRPQRANLSGQLQNLSEPLLQQP
ncbi:zinc c3hc4 type domain-containing protein [Stylonychia lemnae]|uniref:Zinc c3hc4 type domain-containing protein n=1 Tax=Stylonychia lemnae TaxID=5949 RepID=A0A078AVB2_STYLE|nr:zinc c3hc4 type domain-containing protein [Stylonychia lemnae]|eukprot:CDW85966.1 zinc c3hc4 type domain-containing protein [Stylonychia lemnae]